MALSCTPIPPDPGYESTCSFHFRGNSAQAATRCVVIHGECTIVFTMYIIIILTNRGRIRPEAADIAVMHRNGSVGRLFMADPVPSQSRVKRKWHIPTLCLIHFCVLYENCYYTYSTAHTKVMPYMGNMGWPLRFFLVVRHVMSTTSVGHTRGCISHIVCEACMYIYIVVLYR